MKDKMTGATVLLAIALGCEERCRAEIDKAYYLDEKKYLAVYDDTGIEFTNVFSKFTLTTSDYIKKVFSIIVAEQIKGSALITTRVIKKGYKAALTFFTQRNQVSAELYTYYMAEKEGGLEHLSGLQLDRSYMVLDFLGLHNNKPLMETHLLRETRDRFNFLFLNAGIDDIDILELRSKNNKGYEDLVAMVTHNNHVSDSVSILFEDAKLNEELKVIDSGLFTDKTITDYLASSPTGRIINISFILLELFGMSGDILGDAKISRERLISLAKYVQTISNENKMPKRESEIVFLMSLVMYALTQEYDNVRGVHYENAKSNLARRELEQERELADLKVSFENERLETNSVIKDLKLSNASLKKALTQNSLEYSKSLKEAELQNKKLQSELDKVKESEKELDFFRKYYFDTVARSEKDFQNSTKSDIDSLKQDLTSLKGVLIGGHVNLQRKLKEELPSFVFITPDDLNKNLTYVRNYDIIYFYSEHNNHSMFRKLMPTVKNSSVVLSFVSDTTNVDLLIKEMHEHATEEGLLLPTSTVNSAIY